MNMQYIQQHNLITLTVRRDPEITMFKNKHSVVVGMSILHLQLRQVTYCVLKAVEKIQLTPRFYFDIFSQLQNTYKVIWE